MNLVKLQDDLKMLPMAVLQSKAQGQDPQVPPWLATSVLNERMDAQKKAGMAQGAQGPQPSIAEQINQKAGLMALQGQQQQQAQQQMMSQMAQAPQPAPQGVPQPEQQPQPQMMAGGGLARLPVDSRMFDYREGGIIGFQSRGEVPRYPGMIAQEGEGLLPSKTGYEGMDILEFIKKFGIDAYNKIKNAIPGESTEERLARQKREVYEASVSGQRDKAMAEVDKPEPVDSMTLPPRPAMALTTPRTPGGLPSALPKPPAASGALAAPAAPRPRVAPPAPPPSGAAPPTGIQTALPQAPPAQSELEKLQMEALRNEPKAQTMDEARAERKAAGSELLNQPAGLAQLARLKQQQEQYEEGKKSRPMENWMRGLASAARGGIGGFGTAYLETAEGNRAADAAQSAYQDKVMTAVEAAQRGEATEEQKALLASVQGSRTAQSEAARNRLTALGTARNTEAQTQTAGLDRASREKIAAANDTTALAVARIQAATANAAKALGADDKKVQMAEAAFARDPEVKRILDLLKTAPYTMGASAAARAKPYEDQLRKIQGEKYAAFGIKLEGSPGADKAPASAPQRMKFDAKGNPI
jgi:hypothetical protein